MRWFQDFRGIGRAAAAVAAEGRGRAAGRRPVSGPVSDHISIATEI